MTIVLDANVLLRFTDTKASQHPSAVTALTALRARGERLRTLPQSHYEFWVVATRPVQDRGLGLSTTECDKALTDLEILFPLIPDPPSLVGIWRTLVVTHGCHGKVAHDARYVAALTGHGLGQFLTFNGRDFARFPAITVIDPLTLTP